MNQTDIIGLYLNGITASVKMLSELICSSDKADMLAGLAVTILHSEEKAENDIDEFELTFYAPELVKECRSSLLESNRTVIAHLEKIQLHGYHFENLIHALKLENQTLSEKIHFA